MQTVIYIFQEIRMMRKVWWKPRISLFWIQVASFIIKIPTAWELNFIMLTLYPFSTSSSVTTSLIRFHFSWCCSIQTWEVQATWVPSGLVKTKTSPWTARSDSRHAFSCWIELTWPLIKQEGFRAKNNKLSTFSDPLFVLKNMQISFSLTIWQVLSYRRLLEGL